MDSPIVARLILGLLGALAVRSWISFVRGRMPKPTLVDQLLMFTMLSGLFWERPAGVDRAATASASLKVTVLVIGLLVGRLWERGSVKRAVVPPSQAA